MSLTPVTDKDEWDSLLASLERPHVLQSWAWGELKSHHGWTPMRFTVSEAGDTIGAFQALRRSLPHTPLGVVYVPKGPTLKGGADPETFDLVLRELEQLARQLRAIFIKIDPDIQLGDANAHSLARRGWRPSKEQIQFHNTVVLNLTPTEDALLAAMKPKWRYNVRLAERKGVKIYEGSQVDWQTFYEMYRETANRDHFLIRDLSYYLDVWKTMGTAGHAHLFLARSNNEPIAGLVLFTFGKRAWYMYGASRNIHRELMPNHLLQWHAIRWAKRCGCLEYDFWGAPDKLEETAPMFGVFKFKMGFGGEFIERIPAHDYVVNPLLYWAYAVARLRYLARQSRAQRSESIPAPL